MSLHSAYFYWKLHTYILIGKQVKVDRILTQSDLGKAHRLDSQFYDAI